MKKLQLDLHQLAVESFPTAPAVRAAGTVRAHDATEFLTCADCTARLCPTDGSCDPAESCIDSCGETCNCPTYAVEDSCGLSCFGC